MKNDVVDDIGIDESSDDLTHDILFAGGLVAISISIFALKPYASFIFAYVFYYLLS